MILGKGSGYEVPDSCDTLTVAMRDGQVRGCGEADLRRKIRQTIAVTREELCRRLIFWIKDP